MARMHVLWFIGRKSFISVHPIWLRRDCMFCDLIEAFEGIGIFTKHWLGNWVSKQNCGHSKYFKSRSYLEMLQINMIKIWPKNTYSIHVYTILARCQLLVYWACGACGRTELSIYSKYSVAYKLSRLPSHMLLRDEENDFVCVEIILKNWWWGHV